MCYDNYYPYLRTLLLFFENLDYMMLAFSLESTTSALKFQLNLLYSYSILIQYLLLKNHNELGVAIIQLNVNDITSDLVVIPKYT